jgi:hypothetical protein
MPFHTNGKPKGYTKRKHKEKPVPLGGFNARKPMKIPKVSKNSLTKKPKKKIKDY